MIFIELNNNLKLPLLGLGTYPLKGLKLIKVVIQAYKIGWRSFDTSTSYNNEISLGFAFRILKFFGSEKVFITTKLSNNDQRKKNVRASLIRSMKKLGVKQIDLYLMHWPNPDTYIDSWKEMELLYKEGLVGAIGVCNFQEHHLKILLKHAKIVPVVNQIELHPLLTQKPLINFCNMNNINIQAYSPVARMNPKLIENKKIVEIAKLHQKSVPQIIFRWNLQNNIMMTPKSGTKERLIENFDIFDFKLDEDEIQSINSINENFRVRHNPDTVDYYKV